MSTSVGPGYSPATSPAPSNGTGRVLHFYNPLGCFGCGRHWVNMEHEPDIHVDTYYCERCDLRCWKNVPVERTASVTAGNLSAFWWPGAYHDAARLREAVTIARMDESVARLLWQLRRTLEHLCD